MNATAALNDIRRSAPAKTELKGEVSAQAQPTWLTEAVVRTIHPNGFAQSIAFALKSRVSAVYEVAHGLAPRALKAWWIPAIVKVTGDFRILDALEAQVGRVAFQIPVAQTVEHVDVVLRAGAATKEFGDVMTRLGAALSDNTITATECDELDGEIAQLYAAVAALQHVARKAVKR